MAHAGTAIAGQQQKGIDPSRASAAAGRWRRAVADAMGQDPGAPLDQPDRRLLMLRIFGTTQRLAELCMAHPTAASAALVEGPSAVLAETARDLVALERGVGGPDALHAALAPLKNRADIAIAIGELSGQWSVSDATAARVDFAERLVETALQWLVRAAIKRGELSVEDSAAPTRGVFVLAGGDFAHEDLTPYGPLDLVIAYDEEIFKRTCRGADRVFVRIGAEIREAFEGKPGEHALYGLSTPLGTGVGGAGYAESVARLKTNSDGPQADIVKTWLATARVVAGDRSSGGGFLETIEETIWNETSNLSAKLRDQAIEASADPRAVFRRIADLCRLSLGGPRPVFRIASASEIFDNAASARAMTQDAARRLIAGNELAHIAASRAQMIKGAPVSRLDADDERNALAVLCGYADYQFLEAALCGADMDARNTFQRFAGGPHEEIARYRSDDETVGDADKLEDLGFVNGVSLSAAVDDWAKRAAGDSADKRFSAHAPGLLTAFGETQSPNDAVRGFDALITSTDEKRRVFELVGEASPYRDGFVDAFGCFSAAVAPLTAMNDGVDAILELSELGAARDAQSWLSRFTPPALADGDIESFASWRRLVMARIAYAAASRTISFDTANAVLNAVHNRTLTDVFDFVAAGRAGEGVKDQIALHRFDMAASVPGEATFLGFIASDDLGEAGETFARRYLEVLGELGDGVFRIAPDVTHRPGGLSGALTPSVKAFRTYVQSEAVAYDQIMLSRASVVAGAPDIADAAADALRGAVAGSRRADILFRDLDRARAQKMRRDRPVSEWDIDHLEGGRADIELVISTLIYKHASAHPFVQDGDAADALSAMARSSLISDETANALKDARAFWTRLQTVRAFAGWSDPVKSPVRPRFGKLIAGAAGVEKFEQVRPLMRGYADDVMRNYAQIVLGRPSLSVVAQTAS